VRAGRAFQIDPAFSFVLPEQAIAGIANFSERIQGLLPASKGEVRTRDARLEAEVEALRAIVAQGGVSCRWKRLALNFQSWL